MAIRAEVALRLAFKVTASIGLILALSIATSVIVSRHAFVRILLNLTESRVHALASDLSDIFESNLRLGLSLDQMGNGSELLRAALPLDQQLVSLAVVDSADKALYSAGPALDWKKFARNGGEKRVAVVDTGDTMIVWSPVRDPLGRISGWIAAAASNDYRAALVRRSLDEVLLLSGIVLAIAVVLTALGAVAACRGLTLVLRAIGRMTPEAEGEVPALSVALSAGAAPAAGTTPDPLGGIGAQAMFLLDQVNRELDGIESGLAGQAS
jgi:hypothetical protein